jgi:hypothetical protein
MIHEAFAVIQLVFIGLSFFLGSLAMHLIAARVVYGNPKFLDRVAKGVMSSAYVQMTQGKILKKIVSGITDALGKIEIPELKDLIPAELAAKIPPGLLEKVEGENPMDALGGLADMIGGITGGKDGSGGMSDIMNLLAMLSKLGNLGGGGSGGSSGGSKGYKPGG